MTKELKVLTTETVNDYLHVSVHFLYGFLVVVFCWFFFSNDPQGFNIKLRLKKEGILPAIAIGLNDFAGTGFYSSEYIVSSYGIKNFDFHLGLGWGQLNGADKKIKNPLGYIKDSFYDRPLGTKDRGGSINLSQYFSDEKASPFYGISYLDNKNLLLKFEKDPIHNAKPELTEVRLTGYLPELAFLVCATIVHSSL